MKKRTLFTLLIPCLSLIGFLLFNTLPPLTWGKKQFLPFEESMRKSNLRWTQNKLKKKLMRKPKWVQLKELYDEHALKAAPSEKIHIPKIIHQIWLGSPFPEKYKALQQSWIEHHPDWEYRLWTDESLKDFPLQNQALYDSAVNWGEKADILRYEILYRIGGLYVDTDFECLRPFDKLHQQFDFYTGLFNLERNSMSPRLGNGLIGSAPGHPILKECIDNLSADGDRKDFDLIQERTGPFHFTRCFFKKAKDEKLKNVALPYTYFYPLPATQRESISSFLDKDKWIFEESFAIHYWEASWIK